jgi:hypothetical protein
MNSITIHFNDRHAGALRPREFGDDVRKGLATLLSENVPLTKIKNEDPSMRYRITDGLPKGFQMDIHQVHELHGAYNFEITSRYPTDKVLGITLRDYLTKKGIKLDV